MNSSHIHPSIFQITRLPPTNLKSTTLFNNFEDSRFIEDSEDQSHFRTIHLEFREFPIARMFVGRLFLPAARRVIVTGERASQLRWYSTEKYVSRRQQRITTGAYDPRDASPFSPDKTRSGTRALTTTNLHIPGEKSRPTRSRGRRRRRRLDCSP